MKSKLFSRALIVAVIAVVLGAMFAVSAFADLAVADGKLTGKADGVTYTATQINGVTDDGTALDLASTPVAIDGNENLTAGLWKVVGSDASTTVVYVMGNSADSITHLVLAGETHLGYTPTQDAIKIAQSTAVKYVPAAWNVCYTPSSNSAQTPARMVYYNAMYAYLTPGVTYTTLELITAVNTTYEYLPNEVIPMSAFESFSFKVTNRVAYNSAFRITDLTKIATKFIFLVVKADGTLVERTATYATFMDNGGSGGGRKYENAVTVKLADFAETDGYVVGIKIVPFADNGGLAITEGNCEPSIVLNNLTDLDYKVDLLQPAARPALTLTAENKLEGFEAGKTYEYATITINADGGITPTYTALDANTVIPVGLTAVRVAGDGVNFADSLPQIIYIKGAESGTIINTWPDGTTINTSKGYVSDGVAGSYTITGKGPILKLTNNAANVFNIGYWTAYHNRATRYQSQVNPMHIASGSQPVTSQDQLNATEVTYGYTPGEIIPVTDFASLNFQVATQSQPITVANGSLVTRVIFYVVTEDGKLQKREVTKTLVTNATMNKYISNAKSVSVTADDLLKKDGYIIGLQIYPITTTSGATATLGGANNPTVMFTQDSYKTFLPAAPKPALTVDGTTVTGFAAGKTYYYAKIGVDGYGEKTDITTDSVTFTEAGLWAVREVGDGAEFGDSIPVIVYVKGNKIGTIANTYPVGTTYAGYTTTKETIKYLEGVMGTFKEGYWTLPSNASRYIIYFGFPNNLATNGSVTTLADISGRNYTYTYTANEIVPMNIFEYFTFDVSNRNAYNSAFRVADLKELATRVIFYVIDEDGNLVEREVQYSNWTEAGAGSGRAYNQTVTVKLSDFEKTDGYIVGIRIYPYGDKGNLSITEGACDPMVTLQNLVNLGYKVTLPKMDTPELTVDGATITGFDASLTYSYAKANVNGIEPLATDVPAGTTSIELNAGLWAFYTKGDGVNKEDSIPQMILVKGNSTDSILHTWPAGTTIKGDNVAGSYVTTAEKTLQINNEIAVKFHEGMWTSYHLFSNRLLAIAPSESFVIASAQQPIKTVEQLNATEVTYQYTADEIIPLSEFYRFRFKIYDRSPEAIKATGVMKTRFIFYIINDNGELVERELTFDYLEISSNTNKITNTVIGDMFEDKSGYIVGIQIYPITVPEGVTATFAKGSTPAVEILYDGGYDIKTMPEAPDLKVFNATVGGDGAIGGFDPAIKYLVREQGETDWAEVYGTKSIVVPEGIYEIKIANFGPYLESETYTINVEYSEEFVSLGNEVRTFYLSEDFETVEADYEIDVTKTTWISALALNNIKTMAPEADVVILGEGYKFELKAADIVIDETVHYYNLALSLNGASRHDVNYESYKALAGDSFVTNFYIESEVALPFANAKISIYLGEALEGLNIQAKKYNDIVNRLARVEEASVSGGWVTFTVYDQTYVLTCDEM